MTSDRDMSGDHAEDKLDQMLEDAQIPLTVTPEDVAASRRVIVMRLQDRPDL